MRLSACVLLAAGAVSLLCAVQTVPHAPDPELESGTHPGGGSPVPQLRFAHADGAKALLGVSEVEVKVTISGLLAETEVTMVFNNPFDAVLDTELDFPLPESATVSNYALDGVSPI